MLIWSAVVVRTVEILAEIEEAHAAEHRAEDGGDGAFPGFVGGEAGGEFALAEVFADVEGEDVAGPDGDKEEEQKAAAVAFFEIALRPDERQQGERVDDVEEREKAERGIEQDTLERGAEGGPEEQDEGEERQDGEFEVGELDGEEEEEGGGGEQPPERDVDGLLVGEGAVLPCGERGDDGGEDGEEPERAVEDDGHDDGDKDDGGKDAFHFQG